MGDPCFWRGTRLPLGMLRLSVTYAHLYKRVHELTEHLQFLDIKEPDAA